MLKTESVTNILPVQMEPSTAPAAPAASAAPADPNPRYSNHIIVRKIRSGLTSMSSDDADIKYS